MRTSWVVGGALLVFASMSRAAPLVVAAENVYGAVAAEIGGPAVPVISILSNPNQDPHEFEVSPSVAREVSNAAIVIYNGADYDPWIGRLLSASPAAGRVVIEAAVLIGAKPGDNPHLWYDPRTMPAFAQRFADVLGTEDPGHAALYAAGRDRFLQEFAALTHRIAALRAAWAGTKVTASEPVFGDMAAALGLSMRNARFQLAVMNGTEPRASDVAAFEADLKGRNVRVMFYNAQVSDPTVQRLLGIARDSGVPVVGVTETLPPGRTYVGWMLDQLTALDAALRAR